MHPMKIKFIPFAIAIFFTFTASAQPWLDKLDDSLHLQSPGGFFRADLSGLIDLEGYSIDQRPPGLLFSQHSFFNPRLTLFLDTRLGPHLYSFVQFRADRGFDPRAMPDGQWRFDEYLLRYTPFDDRRINLQVGKFATVIGNWVPRHDSWDNPFITAPLPYENVTTITDQTVPGSRAGFLARRHKADIKEKWLPLLWGPAYTSGASVFGTVEKFDYAFEFKNASISSRPAVWDATQLGWENPTISGRLGFRPNAAWNLGVSASGGAYLLPAAGAALPPGKHVGDFKQFTIGQDVGYAWHHWQIWGEVFLSRFEVPNVGDCDTLAYTSRRNTRSRRNSSPQCAGISNSSTTFPTGSAVVRRGTMTPGARTPRSAGASTGTGRRRCNTATATNAARCNRASSSSPGSSR